LKRLAMLISGGGTTMAAILEACMPGGLLHGRIQPVLVASSNKEAGGLTKVKNAGMEWLKNLFVCDPRSFSSRENFGLALLELLDRFKPDIIGQYGWLPKTPSNVVEAYQGRIINQHPGPLDPGRPDFGGQGMYGRRVHCARLLYVRLSAGRSPEQLAIEQFTEAVSHLVTEEYDKGDVINCQRVPILPTDDVISLQERVLPVEHHVQIQTLGMLATKNWSVHLRDRPLVPNGLYNFLDDCKRFARALFPNG